MRNNIAALLLVLPGISLSTDWQIGVSAAVEWAYEPEESKSQKAEVLVEPDLEVELPGDALLSATGWFRHDERALLDDDMDGFRLREFYVETQLDSVFVTLGRQQIVWGKADGIKVLDVVNPQEWREFILDDFDDSRIPLWSLNMELPWGDRNIQLIAVFEQQYHEFPETGEAYRFTSSQFVPRAPQGVPVTINATREPGRVVKDGDYGFRISGFASGWDYSINYLYHYDDFRVFYRRVDPSHGVEIKPVYKRDHLAGASFSNAFGDLTFRAELAYRLGRHFSTSKVKDRDGVVESDEFAYVVGIDWFGLSDMFVSMQLHQSYLLQHEQGMMRDESNTTVTALIERDDLNDTLKSRVLWLHNIDSDDGLIRPKIEYQYDDMTSLWGAADIFYGDRAGLYGQFKDQDRFLLGLEIGV